MIVALVNTCLTRRSSTIDQSRRATATAPSDDNIKLAPYTITGIPRAETLISVIESGYRGTRPAVESHPRCLDRYLDPPRRRSSCPTSPIGPIWRICSNARPDRSRRRCFRAWPRTRASLCSVGSSESTIGQVQRRLSRGSRGRKRSVGPSPARSISRPHSRVNDVPEQATRATGS